MSEALTIPKSNPTQQEGPRWVYLDAKRGVWSHDKGAHEAKLIKGFLGYITRAWVEGNPTHDIPDRWELRINMPSAVAVDENGAEMELGETELRISTPVPFYLIVERIMGIREGAIIAISVRRLSDAKTAFTDVHIWNGRAWAAVRNDEVPHKLEGDPKQKFAAALELIQKHPAWISETGEVRGHVPASNPGETTSVQTSAPTEPTQQERNQAEKEAQRPLDAPVFWNVQLPKAQKVENWDTQATPAQATALRNAIAGKLGRSAYDADFILALERVCSDMGQGAEMKESRAAIGYLYDFTNAANPEQFKAFWEAATYDPFADE